MTTGNAPAASLLGQVRAGAGIAALGVAALVLLWGGAVLGMRFLPPDRVPTLEYPFEWSYVGTGDDVSDAFDVAVAGSYIVEWLSPCGADLMLNEWAAGSLVREVPLGEGSDMTATVFLAAGKWSAEARSDCRWAVRVSRT
jgi:hypothetical protein